ncbi:MAG: hydrogenase maturation protease [Gaiellaceae bacterium MAG52_C11]|nr:hydrogenase maturation protease [Candidatus Gaiellasilicea maunaloa]
MRILVAGVGNVLRGDDGFGVAVAQRLLAQNVPEEVEVLDIGIGGIHLVQELLAGADALVVVDAVDLGNAPGTVVVQRPDVREVSGPDDLADVHYATPERALMFARGLEILPASVWLVGGQVVDAERLGEGLSPALAGAVDPAAGEVRRLVCELGVDWI